MNSLSHKNNTAAKPSMLHGNAKPFVQAKLTVNEPGDMYEQEADAMADRVMRMSSTETAKPVTGLIGKSLQRKCAHCEEEEKIKKRVMRKAEAGNSTMAVSSSFAASLNASKGGGSSLPQGTKSFMENAFSADFSAVKIHTGRNASEMSKGINAKAFTHEGDIYFDEGQYNPNSYSGKKLLAHELTHNMQQLSGISRQTAPPTTSAAVTAPALSASEAAERVSLRLFGTDGYFDAIYRQLEQFRLDMYSLGWYAGDRRSGTSAGATVAQIAIQEASKAAAKKVLEILWASLSTVVASAGGGIASGLVGVIASELIRINSYNPVVTEIASKPAHQIFFEATRDSVRSTNRELQDQWTINRDETIASIGVAGVSQYADNIRRATLDVNNNYYSELISKFLPFATGRSVELETPHSVYTGVGRGFTPFVGSSTYVSTINAGEIYVQLNANAVYNLSIVRTVIPEITSHVASQLNSQSRIFSTLPIRRLIIEANSPIGPARIVWNSSSATFDIPISPHFSREFCRQVYRARTGDTGLDRIGGDSSGLTQHQFAGAVHVYGWLLGLPLNQMNFHA